MSIRVRFAVALTDVAEFLADKSETILQNTAASAFTKVNLDKAATLQRSEAAKMRAAALEAQAYTNAFIGREKVNKALSKRPDLVR